MSGAGPVATESRLYDLAARFDWSGEALARARELAGLEADETAWRRYVDTFLVATAAALILSGIAAFFAWNWDALGRFARFGLLEGGIVLAILAVWRFGIDSTPGRTGLVAASVLTGLLLAVYGQAYQTGADPYEMFLWWTVLVLPWAVAGRQPAMWILVVILANLTLIMYWTQVLDPPEGFWLIGQLLGPLFLVGAFVANSELSAALFALNALALLAWEVGAARDVAWMQGSWWRRVVVFLTFGTVVPPSLIIIFGASFGENLNITLLSPLLLAIAGAACVYYYQFRRRDLFALTLCALAAILVITSVAIRAMLDSVGDMLLLALLIIGQVAAAAYWLRSVARRWEGDA